MSDIWSAHYDSIYMSPLAVDAVLQPGSGGADTFEIRAIDESRGIAVGDANNLEIQTIRPVAFVRASELADNDLSDDDLDGGTLTMNGKDWKIKSHQPKPAPTGEGAGEYYLFLAAST